MKTTILALCFLCATAAFGQSAVPVVSCEPQPLRMIEHPQRATQQSMAAEQNLLGVSAYTFEKGELPLWQFATPSHATPLGDTARILRNEHATAKKAQKVLND